MTEQPPPNADERFDGPQPRTRKPLPPPGSDEAVQQYRRVRFAVLGQWVAVPIMAAAVIAVGSKVGLVILAVLVIIAPMGIRAQRKLLRYYRDRV